jgi:hypothetical protein
MVTAGQWQAVKDTLSRPYGRSLTTSDTFGNSTTNTAYNNLPSIQQPKTPLISYRSNNPARPYDVIIPLLIQQAPYDLMILNTNLIHYYTTLQQPTIPLYMTDTTTYML